MKGRHLHIGLLFIAVCLIVGLGLALFSMSKNDQPITNASSNQAMAAIDLAPEATAPAATTDVAEQPDFVITNALLQDRPTWQDVGEGPTVTRFCEGQKAWLSNGTGKIVTLNQVPNESDAFRSRRWRTRGISPSRQSAGPPRKGGHHLFALLRHKPSLGLFCFVLSARKGA